MVTGLTLYLNHRLLTEDLRPSWFVFATTTLAGLFFVVYAVIYEYQLIG